MSADVVQVERVAASEDEFAFLSRIVDCLADDAPRLVYADWLEERDDPRGTFLRRFLSSFDQGEELPSLDEVTPAWANVTGLTILQKIQESGLERFRGEILRHARIALRLEVDEADFDNPPPTPAALGTTRLGGDPDLPAGASYPLAIENGTPLHFLSQWNLADLQGTLAGRAFPAAGLMSIFRPQYDGPYAYLTKEDMQQSVRFTPPGAALVRLSRPAGEQIERPAPFRPGLRLVETMRVPASLNEWPGVKITYEEYGQFDDVFPTNLGGEAYILLGHATHGNVGEEPIKDRPDWVQLMLVPFMEGPDYGITDMSLSYHLPAADLKAGRFDRLETSYG